MTERDWLTLLLRISGLGLIVLSLAHAAFPARFRWREELARLSQLNREMFYVHAFFISLIVLMMGILAFFGTNYLVEPSPLARWVAIGLAMFWGARLVIQWFGYSRQLWKGKRFETCIHWLFALSWAFLTGVFAWLAISQF